MSVFSGLLDLFGEDADFFGGKTADVRGRGAGQIAWESVPFVSEAVTYRDIKRELAKKDPNWWAIGLLGGAGALGLVPIVGDLAGNFIRQGVKARNKIPAQVKEPSEVNPVMSYKDIPTIKPEDLEGMKVGKTVGDLMQAGGQFTGIDSVPVDPRLMKGGTLFPALESSLEKGIVWADPKATALAKNTENPDVVAVTSMMPTSHSGNIDMGMNLRNTVMGYVQSGRMSAEDLKALHNVDAQKEIVNLMASEILGEIDREILKDLIDKAAIRANFDYTADAANNTTGNFLDRNQAMAHKISFVSS